MKPMTFHRWMRGAVRASLAGLGLLAACAASHATSVLPMTVVDLITHSDAIVAGQVQSVVDGFDARGLPYTEVTLKVSDMIRGQKAETYTFRQFGLDKPRKLANGRVYLAPAGRLADLAQERDGDRLHVLEGPALRVPDDGRPRAGKDEHGERRCDERL